MTVRRMHWITLWDGREHLGWNVDGMPAFRFRWAATGLATRRQLRAEGLCPGRNPPYGLLVWRSGRRFAYLYRTDLAKPTRVPTAAQQATLRKAMGARRQYAACQEDVGYCVPTSTRTCWACELAAPGSTAA